MAVVVVVVAVIVVLVVVMVVVVVVKLLVWENVGKTSVFEELFYSSGGRFSSGGSC